MKAIRIVGRVTDTKTDAGALDLNIESISLVSIVGYDSEAGERVIQGGVIYLNNGVKISIDAENLAIVEAAMEIDAQS